MALQINFTLGSLINNAFKERLQMCQLTNNLYETNRRDSFDFCYLLSIPHLMERSVNIFIVVSVIYF